jgi:uncharacterized protein (TIGR03790 family)
VVTVWLPRIAAVLTPGSRKVLPCRVAARSGALDACRWPLVRPGIARRMVAALVLVAGVTGTPAWAQGGPASDAQSAPARDLRADPRPLLRPVPFVLDRLRAADVGLVINVRDPYSVAVGAYYAQQRGIRPEQILRVELPVQPVLAAQEFEPLRQAIERHFGWQTQALALAWTVPYAVGCNSITAAVTLGYDAALCGHTCGPSRVSLYANARSGRPYSDFRMRLSMLLASRSVDAAKALIDRGVRADGSLAKAGSDPVDALFVTTGDPARNVRAALYPPERTIARPAVRIRRVEAQAFTAGPGVALLSVGTVRLNGLADMPWVPGALADHLTSTGGDLYGGHGQSTALDWLDAGATASHGAVSEPCNHLHKFPQPQWLLGHYLQGSTAIEAYWKSVLWPQQSLFVGEPLAAPFASIERP